MDRPDQRATELCQLKLALAAFALQLDAFEARIRGQSFKASVKASLPGTPNVEFAKQIVFAIKSGHATTGELFDKGMRVPVNSTVDN